MRRLARQFVPSHPAESIKGQREKIVEIQMWPGTEGVTFWTSDMTYEYIRINADYQT